MSGKYGRPSFLPEKVTQGDYERWLRGRAQAHVKRDRRRGNKVAIGEMYRSAIHHAVLACKGRDAYTGEKLDWSLIGKYNNSMSQRKGRRYKREFVLKPTVDHVGDGAGPANFRICGWRTNDAKSDLDLPDFLVLCQAVLEHHGYNVAKRV
jgi:hypothetical protein